METVELFAPGKLFIFGEWSVLMGGRALVGAVPAGQAGCLTVGHGQPRFEFLAPEFSPLLRRWGWSPQGWEEAPGATPPGSVDVVGRVVEAASALGPPSGPLRLEVHSQGLFEEGVDGRQKFGVGSSGAIAALVARALARGAAAPAPAGGALAAALDGHRAAQGGRGSGADVAVSTLGGVITFRLPDAPGLGALPEGARPPEIASVGSVSGLRLLAVWTGREADTRALMGRMRAKAEGDPEGWRRAMAEVDEAAARGIDAWLGADPRAVVEAVPEAAHALERLGAQAGVEVVIEAHRQIAALVAEATAGAGAVKPSGAGGGDMALAFFAEAEVAEAAQARLCARGYKCLRWMW